MGDIQRDGRDGGGGREGKGVVEDGERTRKKSAVIAFCHTSVTTTWQGAPSGRCGVPRHGLMT